MNFHNNSILEMCRVSKEVRIFPILDLNNNQSIHLLPTIKILSKKGYKAKIFKTNYEFPKGANEMLVIKGL